MPNPSVITDDDIKDSIGFTRLATKSKPKPTTTSSDNSNANNNDMGIYIAQLIGVSLIIFAFFLYRLYIRRKKNSTDWKEKETLAKTGLSFGLNLAKESGKAITKGFGLSGIYNMVIGLFLGLGFAAGFTLVSKFSDSCKDKIKFGKIKLGIKIGSTLLMGVAAIATLNLGTVITGVATAAGLVVGAVGGAWLMPKITKFFESKGVENFSGKAQTGFNWGATTGALLGAVVGTCLLPGLGTAAGGLIGAALGTVVFSTATIGCKPIFEFFKSKEAQLGSKIGIIIGAGIGAVLGSFIPVIGTAAGIAVGGMLGFVTGAAIGKIIEILPTTNKNNVSNESIDLPTANADKKALLTQLKAAIGLGALFGGIVGAIFGGPVGAVIGAAVGTGVSLLGLAIYRSFTKNTPKPSAKEKTEVEMADFATNDTADKFECSNNHAKRIIAANQASPMLESVEAQKPKTEIIPVDKKPAQESYKNHHNVSMWSHHLATQKCKPNNLDLIRPNTVKGVRA